MSLSVQPVFENFPYGEFEFEYMAATKDDLRGTCFAVTAHAVTVLNLPY